MTFSARRRHVEDKRETYLKNGFWLERSLFPKERIEALKGEMREIFLRRLKSLKKQPSDPQDLFRTMKDLFQVSLPAYLAAAKLTQYLPSLVRLSVSDEVLNLLHGLDLRMPVISTRAVCHFISDDLSIEEGYHKTPPHQDWRSIQGSLDSVVVWIPFCDIDRQFYPLEVIRESHLRGLLPSEEDPFGHRVQTGLLEEDAFEALEMKTGDCLIFSTFLVHRTSHAGRAGVRVAASFRYNNLDEETFAERNYPNPYIYRPDLTLITPDFPRQDQLKQAFKAVR